MASRRRSFICLVNLLLLLGFFRTAEGAFSCWNNTESSLLNETCSNSMTHLPNIVTRQADSENGNGQVSAQNVSYKCFSYSFMDNQVSSSDDVKTTMLEVSQGCDKKGLCEGVPLNMKKNITVGGQNVTILCCDTNNCNGPTRDPKTSAAPPPASCYQMAYQDNSVMHACIQKCPDPKAACIYSTLYPANQTELSFLLQCDGEHRDGLNFSCSDLNALGERLVCKNITTDLGNVREECCCFGNLCAKPKNLNLLTNLSECSLDSPNRKKDPNNVKKSPSSSFFNSWKFRIGMAAIGAVVALSVCGVIFIMMRRQNRQKNNDRMSLSYRHLAADSAPEEEDDVRMLLT